jgi:hypothetical protein
VNPITYELEVSIRRRAAMPFRVTAVHSEAQVQQIAASFLAAWGIPAPSSLREPAFTEHLAESGEYSQKTQEYRIVAKRSN